MEYGIRTNKKKFHYREKTADVKKIKKI